MKIHQTLHGYEGGHRLLAASMPLPRQAERILAVQTDLSGPSRTPGFDTYLSGYPLHEIEMYAFARTWYAPEHPRPGCVWTHTLLVPFNVLNGLPDLTSLCRLFKRPGDETPFSEEFGTEVIIEGIPPNECECAIRRFDLESAAAVVDALYGHDVRPILLPASNSEQYETLVLGIWSQQWASLRRVFTFSTGSLSGRMLDGVPFQLQVVPKNAVRAIQRLLDNPVVVEETSCLPDRPKWLQCGARDLASPGDSGFRHRLHALCIDLPGERQYFPIAATLASRESPPKAPAGAKEVVEALAGEVSTSSERRSLLAVLLDSLLDTERDTVLGVGCVDLMREIATFRPCPGHGQVPPMVAEKTSRFVERRPQHALQFLRKLPRQQLNAIGESVAEGMLSSVAQRPSAEVVSELRDMVPLLVSLNPEFCAIPETWRGTENQSFEILEVVAKKEGTSTDLQLRAMEAILSAQQHWLAWHVTRQFGPGVLRIVLDWFDGSQMQQPSLLARYWREVLATNVDVTVAWLQETSRPPRLPTLGLITTYINPRSRAITEVPATVWLQSLEGQNDEVSVDLLDRVSAFVLTVGLRGPSEMNARLVARTFERVHSALMHDRLPSDAWLWVSDLVPDLGFFRNWDRAERLRRGVIARFCGGKWPPILFAQIVSSLPVCYLEYLGKSCERTREGKLLLSEVLDLARQGSVGFSREQIAALKG